MKLMTELPKAGYLTSAQVKAYFAISNSTLFQWLADPSMRFLTPIRIGPRAVRFCVEDVRRFEEEARLASRNMLAQPNTKPPLSVGVQQVDGPALSRPKDCAPTTSPESVPD